MLYSERGKPIPPISPPPPKPHTHTQTHDSAVVVPALFCLYSVFCVWELRKSPVSAGPLYLSGLIVESCGPI